MMKDEWNDWVKDVRFLISSSERIFFQKQIWEEGDSEGKTTTSTLGMKNLHSYNIQTIYWTQAYRY